MARTATGSFPIGFRRGWSNWQKNLASVIQFARENQFELIDVADLIADEIKPILSAGLKIGSVDLQRPWESVAASDGAKRKEAVASATQHINSVAKLGVRNFFTVVFPASDAGDRAENFKCAVAGYAELARAIAPSGARIAIEGYPGGAPWYSALCCTPESLRAFFRETTSANIGINFDPSHLLRMGIDPVRFLGEFAPRVFHVHAKDTAFDQDALYEFGNLQPATFAKPRDFGGYHWRYTLPGRGASPWPKLLSMLKGAGYDGGISVELEDEDYNGTEAGEKRGLIAGRDFLMGV